MMVANTDESRVCGHDVKPRSCTAIWFVSVAALAGCTDSVSCKLSLCPPSAIIQLAVAAAVGDTIEACLNETCWISQVPTPGDRRDVYPGPSTVHYDVTEQPPFGLLTIEFRGGSRDGDRYRVTVTTAHGETQQAWRATYVPRFNSPDGCEDCLDATVTPL